MEEERSANWPDHRRRKGFKYHWKWGQCDCITSGSAELVKCLWWPSNSILQIIVCIMSQISLHEGSPANWRSKSRSLRDVREAVPLYRMLSALEYRNLSNSSQQLHTKHVKITILPLSVPHPDPRGNVTAARCSRQLIKRGQEQGRPINEWIIPAHYTHIQISPFTLGFSADYDHRASHPWIIRVLHTWQCGLGLMHVLVSARGTVCSEGWQAWCMEVIES